MPDMIIVAGEALIDLLVRPDGGLSAAQGGGPFNTARTIARLGGAVSFLGTLSSDRFGTGLREALERDGVDLSLARTTDAPTTLAVADLDATGAATFRFHTAGTSAPELPASAVKAALATRPQAFHIGTLGLVLEPIASAIADALTAAAPATLVMLDPNCRPLVIPDRDAYLARFGGVIERADIIKASVDDLAYLAPGAAPIEAARALVGRGPSLVLLSDGAGPVFAVGRSWTIATVVPTLRVVDTVGAGDAFGGAFLARWVELGLGRAELTDRAAVAGAVQLAIEVAGVTCLRAGADPPRRAELGWPPRPSASG